MTKKPTPRLSAADVARKHYIYTGVLTVGLLLFDIWKLIPVEQLRVRWLLIIILLSATAIMHQLASVLKNDLQQRVIIYIFIAIDIIIAGTLVYLERGISSNAVALFAIPIVLSSRLKSTMALATTATLSVAAYAAATIGYFLDNPFEEYRVRLYGTLLFYGLIFYVLALLLSMKKTER